MQLSAAGLLSICDLTFLLSSGIKELIFAEVGNVNYLIGIY